MGLIAEARAKNQARQTQGIAPTQSVGLLAEARAITQPVEQQPIEQPIEQIPQPRSFGRSANALNISQERDQT